MKKWQWILLATGLLAGSYVMVRLAHHAPDQTGMYGSVSFFSFIGAFLCVLGACGAFKD